MTRGSALLAARAAGLLALLAGLLVTPVDAHAAAAQPLRVMLEGDSTTQGFNGDITWRYHFLRELQRQQVAVDLVGSSKSPYVKAGFTSARYARAFDSDHFAMGGSTIFWHLKRVEAEMRVQHPDIVVFSAGINDLRNGASAAATNGMLRRWIALVRSVDPGVTIVISPVLDATDSTRPWLPQRIRELRALEVATVAALDTDQSPIVLADTARGWSVPAMTYDNLHPTATGETFIAQRIAEIFQRMGYLHAAPHIYRQTAWTWTANPRVRQVGRRLQVTWDRQALSGARIWVRRSAGGRATVVSRHYTGSWTTGLLRPGTRYDVRLQVLRMRTSGTWGPTIHVTVRRSAVPAAVSRIVVDAAGVHWTASSGATRYVVKYRTSRTGHWKTRRTKALQIRVSGVRQAKVKAVNAAGSSPFRSASR